MNSVDSCAQVQTRALEAQEVRNNWITYYCGHLHFSLLQDLWTDYVNLLTALPMNCFPFSTIASHGWVSSLWHYTFKKQKKMLNVKLYGVGLLNAFVVFPDDTLPQKTQLSKWNSYLVCVSVLLEVLVVTRELLGVVGCAACCMVPSLPPVVHDCLLPPLLLLLLPCAALPWLTGLHCQCLGVVGWWSQRPRVQGTQGGSNSLCLNF